MIAWLLHTSAQDAEQARLGRVLAGTLLILTALDLLASGGLALLNHAGFNQYTVVSLGDLLALYLLNRAGRVRLTVLGLLTLIMGLLPISAIEPGTGIGAAIMLSLALIIAEALAG